MQLKEIKPGDFSITLGNAEFEKSIASAQWSAALDAPASFTVNLALPPTKVGGLKAADLPPEASFAWNDKGVFKGYLYATQARPHGLTLEYRDLLTLAQKTHDNVFLKSQTLQSVLDKIASALGTSARCTGNFSTMLPAFSLSGPSYFEHLVELSGRYGFYFWCKSVAGHLAFQTIGESARTVSIDAATEVAALDSRQSVDASYSKVDFRFFDSNGMQSKEKRLEGDDLLAPLGPYKAHAGFRERAGWKLAAGKQESHVSDGHQFVLGEAIAKNQASKRRMGQERIALTGYSALALPGDQIDLKKPPSPSLSEGKYLVTEGRIVVRSAIPRAELVAVRA